MLSPSLRVRDIAQHTMRGVQPRAWTDGLGLQPIAVLNGNADASSGTANTPGNWTQIFAAAATASTDAIAAIWLSVGATNSASTADNSMLIDIGAGAAGSETVIVPDVAVGGIPTTGTRPILLPVRVAGNTRIAYRARPATASRNLRLSNTVLANAALMSSPFSDRLPVALETLGTSTATSSGTACTGSSGSWTEITASTPTDYQALVLVPSGPGNGTAVSAAQARLDLGIGASGAEMVVASTRVQLTATNGLQASLTSTAIAIFGGFVPKGSRLAIRHNLSSTPEALCGCVIGVPYA